MEFTERKESLILKHIKKNMGVDEYKIKSTSRERDVVDARRLYMYILREYFGLGFNEIGKITNNHHSTVIYNCKKFTDFFNIYVRITSLPYKDICFQLDLMKDSVEEQVEEIKEQIITINKKIDNLITIKQLQNGRKKLHS